MCFTGFEDTGIEIGSTILFCCTQVGKLCSVRLLKPMGFLYLRKMAQEQLTHKEKENKFQAEIKALKTSITAPTKEWKRTEDSSKIQVERVQLMLLHSPLPESLFSWICIPYHVVLGNNLITFRSHPLQIKELGECISSLENSLRVSKNEIGILKVRW